MEKILDHKFVAFKYWKIFLLLIIFIILYKIINFYCFNFHNFDKL